MHHSRGAVRGALALLSIGSGPASADSNDLSGDFLRRKAEERGHRVVFHRIVDSDTGALELALDEARSAGAQAAIVTLRPGRSGFSDLQYQALDARLAHRMPGFGELFRMLGFAQVGAAAMSFQATAGLLPDGLLVFAIPNSAAAYRLAWDRLIAPELGHLLAGLPT